MSKRICGGFAGKSEGLQLRGGLGFIVFAVCFQVQADKENGFICLFIY